MSDRNTEDIIGALYDMVQDARSVPLAADKCILERDRVVSLQPDANHFLICHFGFSS